MLLPLFIVCYFSAAVIICAYHALTEWQERYKL